MLKNLTVTLCLLVSMMGAFAQETKIYSCESGELKVKPSPTTEFTEWLATHNEKIGKAAPASTKKTTRVTLVFVVDKEGNLLNPKIWRGIGQGYDVYAHTLITGNPFKWLPGQIKDNVPVDTEVYYELDYIKNNNRLMTKANEPLR